VPRRAWPLAAASGATAVLSVLAVLLWAAGDGNESGAVAEPSTTTGAETQATEDAHGGVRLNSIVQLLSQSPGPPPSDARPYQPPSNSVAFVSADGLEEAEIVYGSQPVWSPDGTKIAFNGGGDPPGHSGSTEIYVMNNDGTGAQKVGRYGWSDLMSCLNVTWSWSPDGRFIAYSDQQPGKIYVTASSGSHEPVLLVDGCGPAWSPVTDELAFVVNTPAGWAIYVGDLLSGGVARRLASGDFPSWSPAGGQIAFYRIDALGSAGLYVINSDGTKERLVANLGAFMGNIEHAPQWSPDGTRIMAPRNTQLADLTWRHETVLAGIDGAQLGEISLSRMPSWSPDGKFIAYSDWNEQG
jgi:Tol biopolymer transport system component